MKKNYTPGEADDLDYLAAAGYEAIGHDQQEIDRLKSRIRSRFDGGNRDPFIFNTLMVLVMLGVSFYAAVSPPYSYPPLHAPVAKVAERAEPAMKNMDETPAPGEEQHLPDDPVAPTVRNNPAVTEAREEAIANETLTPMPLDLSAVLPATDRGEELLYSENAPVRFIHGLKVTDYGLLYFRPAATDLRGGLDATFSGDDASFMAGEANGRVYLHEVLSEALLAYKKGSYRECLYLLSRLSEHNGEDLNALFYTGMCHYRLGRYRSAIAVFEKIPGMRNNSFQQEAEYYRALALYKSGDKDASMDLLRKIAKSGGFYADRADAVLDGHEP